MGAERDPTEPNQNDHERCRRIDQHTTAAIFDHRDNEQSKLPVKQGGADGVAAGKAVTRPVHEPAVDEWTMPMHQKFDPFV